MTKHSKNNYWKQWNFTNNFSVELWLYFRSRHWDSRKCSWFPEWFTFGSWKEMSSKFKGWETSSNTFEEISLCGSLETSQVIYGIGCSGHKGSSSGKVWSRNDFQKLCGYQHRIEINFNKWSRQELLQTAQQQFVWEMCGKFEEKDQSSDMQYCRKVGNVCIQADI